MKTRQKAKLAVVREPVVYKQLRAMESLPVEADLITALQNINEAITTSTNIDELLQETCEEMGRYLRADRVHLALKSNQGPGFGRVDYEWLSGAEYIVTRGAELPSENEDEVMMDLVATPPPLAVIDPLGSPTLPDGPRKVYELMQVKSAMAGRLQYQGKVLGVLCVHQCNEVRNWTQAEATFLSVVLSQLSIAIANARMIKSLQAQHEELVTLHFKLEESHAQLEKQVAERTAQLREANAELVGMIEELKQVDRLKSSFLDTISHELRTPINFITGFGSLLNDGVYGELTDDGRMAVAKILTGADRLIRLVDDLLDQSKMERGQLHIQPEVFDYTQLMDRIASEFSPLFAAKNQRFEVELPADMPAAYADPDRVHQVLRNLLSNAIKFTPEGGRIAVRVVAHGGQLITDVQDTGIGIPDTASERIFERFYQVDNTRTRNYGGTGLGLAIVKGLLEAMHGVITVTSRVDQGTTFRFSLPIAPATELTQEIPHG
jgi:signal transduction histidine kinase